jgi:hypothetical protein
MNFINPSGRIDTLISFNREFTSITQAPHEIQSQVREMVRNEIDDIFSHSPRILKSISPQLIEKYKRVKKTTEPHLRSSAMNPVYAHAVIMEYIFLSVGDDAIFNTVMKNVLAW